MSKIKLPRFDYMCQDNTYSGSVGNFRYKFFPTKVGEDEKIFIAAVYSDNCFEVEDAASRTTKKEFEYSPKGIEDAEMWLLGQLGD